MLVEIEAGYAKNEPVTYAVRKAIEAGVVSLIKEGAELELWKFGKTQDELDLIEAELAAEDEEKLRLELELEAAKKAADEAAKEMQAEIDAELDAKEKASLDKEIADFEAEVQEAENIVEPETNSTVDESGDDNDEVGEDTTNKSVMYYFAN